MLVIKNEVTTAFSIIVPGEVQAIAHDGRIGNARTAPASIAMDAIDLLVGKHAVEIHTGWEQAVSNIRIANRIRGSVHADSIPPRRVQVDRRVVIDDANSVVIG